MKSLPLIISLFRRALGIFFLVLNYLSYGLMVKVAADGDLSATERVLYPVLIYLVGWILVIAGIYLAGPEIIDKIKFYFKALMDKLFKKKK
tara:strand:+ start:4601 stop:4873 length:273 start_codon:yes stop_codon:yes gene_type:complete